MTTEWIAQGIGLVAMAMNLLSYQQKKQRSVICFQFFGCLLFGVNYFMLGAVVGGLLNCIGVIRAAVFLQKERFRATHPAWLWGFSAMYVVSYVLSFTVFHKPLELPDLIVELLPVIAMIVATYSYRFREARDIRRFGLVCSPLWLIYNLCNFSIGAICCEVLNLVSIGVGMLRFDIKKQDKSNQEGRGS